MKAERRRARDERIAEIPWVRRVTRNTPCQGLKHKKIALKHLYEMNGRPPEGIPDSARCKFRAKWHLTALRPRKHEGFSSRTGDYCIHHLFSEIYSYQREYERYVTWRKEQGETES